LGIGYYHHLQLSSFTVGYIIGAMTLMYHTVVGRVFCIRQMLEMRIIT